MCYVVDTQTAPSGAPFHIMKDPKITNLISNYDDKSSDIGSIVKNAIMTVNAVSQDR
jgi:hypothetical protein